MKYTKHHVLGVDLLIPKSYKKRIEKELKILSSELQPHLRSRAPGQIVCFSIGGLVTAIWLAKSFHDSTVILVNSQEWKSTDIQKIIAENRINNIKILKHPNIDSAIDHVNGETKTTVKELAKEINALVENEIELINFGSFELGIDLIEELKKSNLIVKFVIGTIFETQQNYYDAWNRLIQCSNEFLIIVKNRTEKSFLYWENDNRPEISIILPIYNVAEFLENCLTGLTQQFPDYFEIIAVNDGSTDNSREIILDWIERFPNIRLVDKENGGCASARSLGLKEARGKFIGFVDPDDWTEPEMFVSLHKAAILGNIDITQCGFKFYMEGSKSTSVVDEPWVHQFYSKSESDEATIRKLIPTMPSIWRRLYSKIFLEEFKIDFHTTLRRFDDLPFHFETFSRCRTFRAIPGHYYNYRIEREGQDVAVDDERLFVHEEIFELLNNHVSALGDYAVARYVALVKLGTHYWGFSKIKDELRQDYAKMAINDLRSTPNMSVLQLRSAVKEQDFLYKLYGFSLYLGLGRLASQICRIKFKLKESKQQKYESAFLNNLPIKGNKK